MPTARAPGNDDIFDVAIVGYGPVGQALAALLGAAGHRVAAFERFDEIYRLPRAVHLDHEIMRLLQLLDIAEELEPDLLPFTDYQWFGADGEPLMSIHATTPAASGWEPDYMFFQPRLEEALDRRARSHPTVTVERGWSAEGIDPREDGIELTLRRVASGSSDAAVVEGEVRQVRAHWVVGADGANSFVRDAVGIGRRDLGFQEQWLVADLEPHDMNALAHLPKACQWCDPRRPTTHVQSGRSHRRWEFMLLPGERASDFDDPERVWSLLEPWFSPDDGILTRHAVYEFRSVLTERMRDGRVLLAGDAAHLTPPFLGQGLCSGMRDALNIAWKLDLALRELAPDDLLGTVERERQPQNEWVISVAVELGRVLCQLDVEAASERDAAMRAAEPPPELQFAPLTDGLLRRGEDGAPGALAGSLGVQGRVRSPDGEGLLDDLAGGGFALIAATGDPWGALDRKHRFLLEQLDISAVSLDPACNCGVEDLDGRLTAWLSENDVHAVLVRPDFYVFGSAGSANDLPALLDELREQLGSPANDT